MFDLDNKIKEKSPVSPRMLTAKARKLLRIIGLPAYWRALSKGVGAAVEHENVLGIMNCEVVLDVGANRGQFAIVARRMFPAARIVCFEPLPYPREKINQIVDGDVYVFPYAIGRESRTLDIHVSARDDSSSLLPITAQKEFFPGTHEVRRMAIEVRPLSELVTEHELDAKRVLLKIDVQGYEFEVLNGCLELLRRVAWIYVECSFLELYEGQKLVNDVIRLLENSGFMIEGIYNAQYARDGRALQADFLFRRASDRCGNDLNGTGRKTAP